jgi:predicted metal-dependent hydrolase
VTDPRGHSYGAREEVADLEGKTLPQDWRNVEEYLLGVDLYNRAFFWEAHESWEAVWHAVGKGTVVGRFLQGLIQASAALLQHHVGHSRGARNLIAKSDANLQPAREWLTEHGTERYMGISLRAWESRVRSFIEGRSPDFPFLDLSD